MSIPVETLFIDSFDTEVKLAYQGAGMLRDTVRVKTGVKGERASFNKYGKGVMTQFNKGNDLTAQNVDSSLVWADIADYNYSEYVFMVDVNKLAIDERQAIAESAGLACGRKEDQLIINALVTAVATGTFPADQKIQIAGSDAKQMSVTQLRGIKKLLDDNNVPSMDRFAVVSPQIISDLLGSTAVTSSDYNVVKTLVDGQVDSFMGFKFKVIGDRDEGGLPSVAYSTKVNYMSYFYHKKAVGLAIGLDKQTGVDYVAEKGGWLFTAWYCAGAVAIDFNGIVVIQTGETANS